MKVNWFSPLPPQPTGIADFTGQLLPFLSAAADVTVWTDGATYDRRLERYADIRRIDEANPTVGAAAGDPLNIYHIGNNGMFHTAIWEISRQCPGIVVLHDVCLQDLFFYHFCERLKDPDAYLRAVGKYYGKVGVDSVEATLQGHIQFDHVRKCFPLTELAVERAAGVVVHTHKGQRALQRHDRLPLLHLPLAYAPNRPRVCQLPAAAPGCQPSKPYQLIVFGHLGPNRGIAQILEALGTIGRRDQFHLNIYGMQRIPPKEVQLYIERWKLRRCVTLHGAVAEPVLEAALNQSDLAINLRFPTMGEASHSHCGSGIMPCPVSSRGRVGMPASQPRPWPPFGPVLQLAIYNSILLASCATKHGTSKSAGWETNGCTNSTIRKPMYPGFWILPPKPWRRADPASRQERPRFSGWSSVALRERLQDLLAAKMDRWCPNEVKRSIHARADRVMRDLQGKES